MSKASTQSSVSTEFAILFDSWPIWVQKLCLPFALALFARITSLLIYCAFSNHGWGQLFRAQNVMIDTLVFAVPGWIAILTNVRIAAMIIIPIYALSGTLVYGFDPLSLWGLVTQLLAISVVFLGLVPIEARIKSGKLSAKK